jgi:hypothetical protein
MNQKPIEQWWDELDVDTRQWFLENPGVLILPRTVANVVQKACGGQGDQHGELKLSAQDQDFVKAKALNQDRV